MADIAASDVSYVVQNRERTPLRMRTRVKVTFGDGALLYPAGGVPLTKAKLGCYRYLESVDLFDENDASVLVWKYDAENEKLRAYDGAFTVAAAGAIGANMEIGLSADAATATCEGGTGISAARTLTTTSPAKLLELGNVAVAAQTFYVSAKGF